MSEFTKQVEKALSEATPGPWEAMNGRDIFTTKGATNRAGITADHNDGWQIADALCGPAIVNGEEWDMGYAERISNAELIANAPTWIRQLLEERALLVNSLKFISCTPKEAEAEALHALKQVGELS